MTKLSRIALFICAIALTLGLGASLAAADNTATPATPNTTSTTAAGTGKLKVKTLIFGDGSDVEGGVIGPEGEQIGVRDDVIHSNLIRVRQDFIREIFKSAENL